MAVTIENSVELANQLAHPPVEMESNYIYGKLRVYSINFTQGAAAGDIGSTQRLIRLPAGKIRLLAPNSWLKNSAWTATATIDIGWEAYRDKSGVVVAADPDGIVDGRLATNSITWNLALAPTDAVGGVQGAGISDNLTKVFESSNGVVLTSTNGVATIPAGATLKGFVVVAVE
jgi:hypothetical protein